MYNDSRDLGYDILIYGEKQNVLRKNENWKFKIIQIL